jgi:hypothetical protein
MINSETLQELNILIQKNKKLNKCIFFATLSNADSVRDVIAKNIYFSLSALSVVLKGFLNIPPNYVMTIVSDLNTPYYNQIYNTGPKPVYRISELTVEKVNNFADSGTALDILIGLNDFPTNEFEKLNKILLDPACKYRKIATFIELETIDIPFVEKLNKKLAKTNNIASNVSLCGVTNAYPDIDSYTLYQNSAIQFVNFYDEWCKFIKQSIVFNRFSKFNKNNQSSIKTPLVVVGTPVELAVTITSTGNNNNNNINSGNFGSVVLSGLIGIAGCSSDNSQSSNNSGMYYTIDGGKSWTQSNTNNTNNPTGTGWYYNIALSGSIGIACDDGYRGIIYTSDGGKNWNKSNNTTGYFTSLALSSDGKYGIAGSGERNGIWYTTTYGQTWTQSYNNTGSLLTGNFNSMIISPDGTTGIAGSGEGNGIYYTNSGSASSIGEIWIQSNVVADTIDSVALSDSNGIANGSTFLGSYYSNTNSGSTTSIGEIWKPSNIIQDYLSSVFLSSDGKNGMGSSNNYLYYTNTNTPDTSIGQNWTICTEKDGTTPLIGNFSSAALSDSNGIASGKSNNGLYYTNTNTPNTSIGQNWTPSNIKTGSFGYASSIALSIVSNSSGESYIAGIAGGNSNNGIYYTNNLTPGTYVGQTWTQSTLNPNPNPNSN